MDVSESNFLMEEFDKFQINSMGFNGVFLNARSIKPEGKFDDIKQFINLAGDIDVICLAETWLNQEDVKFFSILGYKDYHFVRASLGGGLTVYLKENVNCLNYSCIGNSSQIMVLNLVIECKKPCRRFIFILQLSRYLP